MSRLSVSGRSNDALRHALVGAGLCLPVALIAYSDGVQEGHHPWQMRGLAEVIALGVVGGGIAGAISFWLRWLERRGRALSYLRWIAATTFSMIIVIGPDIISARSLEPLLAALFLGLCGGLGIGAIAGYLRQD